jgi:hypothetical protein
VVQSVGGQRTVRANSAVRVSIHLSKQGRNGLTFHPSDRDNIKAQHKPQRQNFCFNFLKSGTESAQNERSTQIWMLTGNDTDLDEVRYTKVVGNFDTFPANI